MHLRRNALVILMFLLDVVNFQNLLDLQLHYLLVTEKEWTPEFKHVNEFLHDLHNTSLHLFRCLRMMFTTISHHRKKGNGDGQDRVSENILVHKRHKNHNFNRWMPRERESVRSCDLDLSFFFFFWSDISLLMVVVQLMVMKDLQL